MKKYAENAGLDIRWDGCKKPAFCVKNILKNLYSYTL